MIILSTPFDVEQPRLNSFKFPGGELQVKVSQLISGTNVNVQAVLKSSDDIMELLLVCNSIQVQGCTINNLVIPYMPYARQDRVIVDLSGKSNGEAFSLKVMADLINSIGAKSVIVYDPHSDVTPALINNCKVVTLDYLITESILDDKVLICPDAGAEKRIAKLQRPYVMATKTRDPFTGNIAKTSVHTDIDLKDKTVLIVDDICDGGRTFIELAKVLKEKHFVKSVELYVTHGIFSNGFEVFKGLIDKIYYYDDSTTSYYDQIVFTTIIKKDITQL